MLSNIDIESNVQYKSKVIDGITHIYYVNEFIIDRTNFEQRIKVAVILSGKTLGEISKQFGLSQPAFFSRCRTGKMTFDEQRKIAEILGCKSIIKFVFDDGKEILGENVKQMITEACSYAKITQIKLSELLGKSKQTFNSKLRRKRFSDAEIYAIAEKIGCQYYNYFELADGTRI